MTYRLDRGAAETHCNKHREIAIWVTNWGNKGMKKDSK